MCVGGAGDAHAPASQATAHLLLQSVQHPYRVSPEASFGMHLKQGVVGNQVWGKTLTKHL